MKKIYYYILFIVLIVYHILSTHWWTPWLYYTGTYGILLFALIEKYQYSRDKSFLKICIYFGLIYLYAMLSVNKDISIFFKKIHIREIALGFGGIALILFMFFKHEKRKIV